MAKSVRVVFYVKPQFLKKITRHIRRAGCSTLSEAVRDLCRRALVEHDCTMRAHNGQGKK